MHNLCRLLPMPFGHSSALEFTDEASCGEFLARLPDAPSRFGRLGADEPFHIRLKHVPLPEVSLLAGTSTPKATDHCSRRLALVIPFGRCETVLRAGRESFRWAAPRHAFFVPAGQRIEAESTAGAFLRLDIVTQALERTAAGMAGPEDRGGVPLDLDTARPVPLRGRGIDWLPVIRSHCRTVDACDCAADALLATGLDDALLRMVVMMLRPDPFLAPGPPARPVGGFDLDALLERIEANLGQRVTLADMEAWSDRTSRAIQLAFQRRFGRGPMAWLRERRLDRVHALLRTASDGATVRGIAAACGMPRMATLIPEYARRFGELPSETLARAGR